MEITHKEFGPETAVVTLSGRITLGEESERIEKVVSELLGEGRRNVIFDLAAVTHIDSTGIGHFIASLNRVMQAGGRMRMAGATGQIREAFKVTRLDTVFEFYPDVETASQSLP